ncbi:MAG: type 4a pilus biogenesis protein PilO [Deltaproteobacteria bacterium]|nr:type 4a pilus biogenesis protein PilO [Deltaproteobacteria bacterium]
MALTLDDIKNMPPKRKAMLLIVVFLLLGFAYYSVYLQKALSDKGKLEENLASLKQQIAQKQLVIEEMKRYEKEIANLKKDLEIAMAKLPEQKEIPGLLISVSEAGGYGGVEFLLFEPMEPVWKEFYAELPVKITVNGGYHDTAQFFERVAKLPRIVNISNIAMEKAKNESKSNLTTTCLIKTYMFGEKAEAAKKVDDKAKKPPEKNIKQPQG